MLLIYFLELSVTDSHITGILLHKTLLTRLARFDWSDVDTPERFLVIKSTSLTSTKHWTLR